MIYRITIDMIFNDYGPVDDILDKCRDHEEAAITLNPGTPYAEHSKILAQECHHNSQSPEPCHTTYTWESSP